MKEKEKILKQKLTKEKIMKHKKCWNTANKEKKKRPSKGAKMIKTERDNEKKRWRRIKRRIKMKE